MSATAGRVPAGPALLAAIEAGRAEHQPLTEDARRVLARVARAVRPARTRSSRARRSA